MRLRAVLGLVCALGVALLAASPASADIFGPISLVSEGALGEGELQQAEYAHDTAISGDGRYVVFDGSIGGVTGVWRRDLQSGALQQVAGGDAELPSASEDGRYVSFTTNEGASLPAITFGLVGERPAQTTGLKEAVNVYVRDMTRQPDEAGAFILASAANGPGEPVTPLTYQVREPVRESTEYGAAATGRSAISADGNEVAFVTTAVSDLAGPSTPPFQVAVRYLDTHETKLVSRCFASCQAGYEPAVGSLENGQLYGAVYTGGSAVFAAPPTFGNYGTSSPPGASISGDGSTVAWMGEDIGQQARLLANETRSAHYTEPLWRRIEPGSETPTERVTGGSDPTDPQCEASGETVLPADPSLADPCQGPFAAEEQAKAAGIVNEAGAAGASGNFVPRLSADGGRVVFVSEAPLVSLGEDFGRGRAGQPGDLYMANMRPGLTRIQALTSLTELAGGENAGTAATAPIFDFDISPDGSQIAFATRRIEFPLGTPAYVSPPAGEAGMNELFDIDLDNDTLTRVTHGYGGLDEVSEHTHTSKPAGEDPYVEPGDGSLSPSFTTAGTELAFVSTASNLVFGDGNAPPGGPTGPTGVLDGSDAFAVERTTFASLPTPQYISPAPHLSTQPAWRLGVSALARRDGSVAVYVDAPGAGTLRAAALSAVRLKLADTSARRTARSRLRGARAARLRGHRVAGREVVATRTVAAVATQVRAGTEDSTLLVLRLAKPYAALASQAGGLSADIEVVFSEPGAPTLRQSVPVTFRRVAHLARKPAQVTTRDTKANRRRPSAQR